MDWTKIGTDVAGYIKGAEPFIEAAASFIPGAAAGISIGKKLLDAIIAAEPAAVDLYKRIKSGETPTESELQRYFDEEDEAYKRYKAASAARRAELNKP